MAEYEISKEQLLKLIRYDCETFLALHLKDELTLDVPEFHIEIWDEFLELLDKVNDPANLTEVLYKLLGVPREHAKTTLVKLACVLFFRYSRLSFLAYVSNTFNVALNAVKDIKDYLFDSKLQELYGETVQEKSSDTTGEVILWIAAPIYDKPKCIIMKAFGVNTQIRGTVIKNKRPDLLVFDDCESRETADNPAIQAKLDSWCMGTALKSMAKGGVCIFIGNMLADTTLLARLAKDPKWNATVFGSIIRNKDGTLQPLWPHTDDKPGRWTLPRLFLDYASYLKLGLGHVWEAEMMNLTNKDILGESFVNAVRPPEPAPESLEAGFICLDPAFGENSWNDDSAITVHARFHGGTIPCIIDGWRGKADPEQLLNRMLEFSFKWGITTWAIESQAAQKLLITLFRMYLAQRGIGPEFFPMIALLAGKDSKSTRIYAIRKSIASGAYAISENMEELFRLIEAYAPGIRHDDYEDSAAYGLIVWAYHEQTVVAQGRINVLGTLLGLPPIAGSTISGADMGV